MRNKKKLLVIIAALSLPVQVFAWDVAGTGGTADLKGVLLPKADSSVWEVLVNASANLGDVSVKSGATSVIIPVIHWVPILGIRTTTNNTQRFVGGPGISPQIDFNGAVDLDGFNAGDTTLTLPVVNSVDNSTLGTLTLKFTAGAEYSWQSAVNTADVGKAQMFASSAGQGFYGGLPKSDTKIYGNAWSLSGGVSGHRDNYNGLGGSNSSTRHDSFSDTQRTYSGFYSSWLRGGGGTNATLSLNKPMAADIVSWKASFPITISYN